MRKKDYILIENQFKNALQIAEDIKHCKMTLTICEVLEAVIKDFGRMLYQDNPKFNAEKFAEACGLPEENETLSCNICAGMSNEEKKECSHNSYSIK